jgi:hypothetical protein
MMGTAELSRPKGGPSEFCEHLTALYAVKCSQKVWSPA